MADGDRIPKVLVVDDEPNIRELVEVALKFHGCAVAVSATGKDALRQVETYAPDLMILDVMLPDMDGFEVCRTLRVEGNDVPVIFLTARAIPPPARKPARVMLVPQRNHLVLRNRAG